MEGPDFGVGIWAREFCGGIGLLVVALGQFCGDGFEVAEEAACAVVGAGGEVEFGGGRAGGVGAAGGGAVAGA